MKSYLSENVKFTNNYRVIGIGNTSFNTNDSSDTRKYLIICSNDYEQANRHKRIESVYLSCDIYADRGTDGYYYASICTGNLEDIDLDLYEQIEISFQSMNFNTGKSSASSGTFKSDVTDPNVLFKGKIINTACFTIYSKYVNEGVNFKLSNASFRFNYAPVAEKPIVNSDYVGGFVDRLKALVINYSVEANQYIHEQFSIKSGVFHYRKSGTGSYTNISFTGSQCNIPTGTFEAEQTYDVYTTITVDDGQTADTEVKQLLTVDSVPSAIPLEPNGAVTYGDVTFRWLYSNETGTPQYAFDIEYSSDGSRWTRIADRVLSANTEFKKYIETSGSLVWRVKTYNQNDVASEWSSNATFINNIPLPAPEIISIVGTGRKTISWNTGDQVGYQVQVLLGSDIVYDSGTVYSTEKSHFINDYLKANIYSVRVRVINVYGKYSEWKTTSFQIVYGQTKPIVKATDTGKGVNLEIGTNLAISKYYIKRNGIPIGKTSDQYGDYFVNGNNNYEVIAVASDDSYAIAELSVSSRYKKTMMRKIDGEEIECNRRFGNRLDPQSELSPDYAAYKYIGAKRPVHVFSKLQSRRYTLDTTDKRNIFNNLVGEVLFYANKHGESDWVVITGINRSNKWYGNDVQLSLEATEYDEAIEYDI